MTTRSRHHWTTSPPSDGTFAVVAMDQRNTLKRMYAAVGIDAPATSELVDIKADVVEALAPVASAFLLDPTYGIPALEQVDPGVRRDAGILVAAEPSERAEAATRSRAAPATRPSTRRGCGHQGGDALKFLIQIRADRPAGDGPDLAAEVLEVIRQVVEDCRNAGVPSVIENLIYPLPGEELTPAGSRERDHRGRDRARLPAAGPAQARVPGQPGGLPAAGGGDLEPVGGALGGRGVRRVHARARGVVRRGRRVRLHRRPGRVEGDGRHEPAGASGLPGRRRQATARALRGGDRRTGGALAPSGGEVRT